MKFKLLAATIALSAWTVSVNATPVNVSQTNGENSLQTILDNLSSGGSSAIDVNTDQADPDDVWINQYLFQSDS